MRNHPLWAREQARIRVLSILALMLAIGLTWASLFNGTSNATKPSDRLVQIAQKR